MIKILVIAPQYVGDSILVIPFLRNLRKAYPNDLIDIVTKNAGKLVLSVCPYVNNVYEEESLYLEERLKPDFYDNAYVLKRSLSAAILAKKLRIKNTIGFGGQFREFILNKSVKYKPREKHELEHFLDVLKAENIETNDKTLEYWTNDEDINSVQK